MKRDIFAEEHELLRDQFRRFAERELAPRIPDWNSRGMSDRESWLQMGEQGYLGCTAPEEYGGSGGDFLYDAVIMEELARIRAHGLMCAKLSSEDAGSTPTCSESSIRLRLAVPGSSSGSGQTLATILGQAATPAKNVASKRKLAATAMTVTGFLVEAC